MSPMRQAGDVDRERLVEPERRRGARTGRPRDRRRTTATATTSHDVDRRRARGRRFRSRPSGSVLYGRPGARRTANRRSGRLPRLDDHAPADHARREPPTRRRHRRRARRPHRRLRARPSAGARCTVLEADDVVGGISRTVERDGWRFDIGGHRFFTKVPEVEALLARDPRRDEFLRRPRMSRIFYERQALRLPAQGRQRPAQPRPDRGAALRAVVPVGPHPPAEGPDQLRGLGRRPASAGGSTGTFFKTYTEKVWGVPATEITADWAAQRIKNLSLGKAVWQRPASPERRARPTSPASSTSSTTRKFGPGQMWERCTRARRPPRAPRSSSTRRSRAIERDGDRAVDGRRRRRAPVAVHGTSSRRCRSATSCSPWTRRRRPRSQAAAKGLGSPRPPARSPSSCPRSSRSPTTGSTSTTPGCSSAACRTSAPGRRTW